MPYCMNFIITTIQFRYCDVNWAEKKTHILKQQPSSVVGQSLRHGMTLGIFTALLGLLLKHWLNINKIKLFNIDS